MRFVALWVSACVAVVVAAGVIGSAYILWRVPTRPPDTPAADAQAGPPGRR